MNSNWITVWQAQHFPTYNPKAVKTAFGLCWTSVAVTVSPTSPYTVKRKLDPCHLRSKGNSASPGHSLRRDTEDLINRFALYVPSVGRQSVGWQKRLFLQYISRVITGGSIALTERKYYTSPKTGTTGDIWLPPAETIRIDPQTSLYINNATKPHITVHSSWHSPTKAYIAAHSPI